MATARRRVIQLNGRPIGDVAGPRVQLSDNPRWFRTCMARALADIDRGEDLTTTKWPCGDPIKCAAEIEAVTGLRRLATFQESSHV